MKSIKLKTSIPKLQVRVNGLSENVVLVVFGVKAPAPGTFAPVNEPLGELTTGTPVLELTLAAQGAEFRHAALKFAMTTFKNDVGTTQVKLTRAQDAPVPPSFERPVHLTLELQRPSSTAPVYLEESVVLEEDA